MSTDPETPETANPNSAPEPQPANLPSAKPDAGAAQVEAKVDAEQAKGYHGTVPDPTPDANYTVAGVIAGLPTPETTWPDAEAPDDGISTRPKSKKA